MNRILEPQVEPILTKRSAGLSLIAGAFAGAAVYLASAAALIVGGRVPLAMGAPLLGGFETMGPWIFVISALLAAIIACGLLRGWNWSRRLAVASAAAIMFTAVPSVSSAVADGRWPAIVREGAKIILSVAAIRYLYLEPVNEFFANVKE